MIYASTSCLKNPKNVIKVLNEYQKAEINAQDNEIIVLVSAESINNLRKAYPNYFADCKNFLIYMKDGLENNIKRMENKIEIEVKINMNSLFVKYIRFLRPGYFKRT